MTQPSHQSSARGFQGQATSVAPGAVHPASHPGSQTSAPLSGLGLGATEMQSLAWEDLNASLKQILDQLHDDTSPADQQMQS